MKFGYIKSEDAEGCILAHSVRLQRDSLKKGTVLNAEMIGQLQANDIGFVMAARLQSGDVPEDEAAGRIATAIAGNNIRVADTFTGRANIYAQLDGIFDADVEQIKSLNRIDETMTIATLNPLSRVNKGQMVATVKIIPFAVSDEHVTGLEEMVRADAVAISVAPFRPLNVALIITRFPGDKESVLEKRHAAMAERIKNLGGHLKSVRYSDHRQEAVATAIRDTQELDCDLVLVFGASAIVDRADVIPAALVEAGGEIQHLGMPVDPGNLLLYGALQQTPVIGVPSCAASVKENGFDWVLERIFAGLPLDREAFISMAAGGLLMEISTRPQPREKKPETKT